MGSTPRSGASGPREEPEDDAARTPEPETPEPKTPEPETSEPKTPEPETREPGTGPTPSTPGEESLREALHRRMREVDDRRAGKPAPGDDKAPADDVEPEEPPD
ncbi:hypothetical protein AB0M57_16745 [Streptomyces sp. NPDC051597]|uniref:hypothetical protein n=1 Tax=Streptomyces sp. NPDC051597 TaxID=3155049 RepID=UPI00341DF76A